MPAEHRLSVGHAGLYGKHPGFGDFIAAGLPETVLSGLGDWLQSALGAWRDGAGDGWQAAFDASPRLAFWIGPVLAGGTALRGVWAASHDRTGRRFPLLVMQTGGAAPVADGAQDFYDDAGRLLDGLIAADTFDPRETAQRLQAELPAPSQDDQPGWPTFWARNDQQGPQDLLAQLPAADHAHAISARSYCWFAGAMGSGVLACQGLPGPAELGWLIAGGRVAETEDVQA